jgi:hypothetical protein
MDRIGYRRIFRNINHTCELSNHRAKLMKIQDLFVKESYYIWF